MLDYKQITNLNYKFIYELQTRADISVCQGSLTVWETIFFHLLGEKVVLIRNQIEWKSGVHVLLNCGCHLSTKGLIPVAAQSHALPVGSSCPQGNYETLVSPLSLSFKIDMISGYLQT